MITLTPTRQHQIEEAVQKLKDDTGLSYPGNTLLEFALAKGIRVYSTNLQNPRISGVIKLTDQKGHQDTEIYLNQDQSPERNNFTLAHELGHYLLGHSLNVKEGFQKYRIDKIDYNDPTNKDEIEANLFAATLLMPRDKLAELLRYTKDLNLIAKHFGVSPTALKTRILWLKQN